ncbi:hypothetical protein ACJRO7_035220 [Eucalyptus globulus]|uniref:Protein LYK2 n=1 Tax=Eucalyptus globulus TaxID=34317 RepID=A0ABD3JAC2_EUCGL
MDKEALLISEHQLRLLVLSICFLPSFLLGEDLLSCETSLPEASWSLCIENESPKRCHTFAVLRANPYYSSLSNLSFYLGIGKSIVAEANGFSADTEFLPLDQPLAIPVECKCSGRSFRAELIKNTIRGESFRGIAESLEGLTTCRAIQEANPGIPQFNLNGNVQLHVPLKCACPSSETSPGVLLTYPVSKGDTLSGLASKFNTTPQAIISVNNKSLGKFDPRRLIPSTSILIPIHGRPMLGSAARPHEPIWDFEDASKPIVHRHKKKSRMWEPWIYVTASSVAVGISGVIVAVIMVMHHKRRNRNLCKPGSLADDVELQQLSLSVRTTSDKKVSFDGSQGPLDGQVIDATPRKMQVEMYTIEELKRATEDFNVSNQIEGSVYHGRLGGKNLAVKMVKTETFAKIEFGLFHDATHKHPNIIRLLGTCPTEGPDSYLVFEYAKNGSLKDWLHGGLAIKSQFIASCYCFLTWSQRLRICLDVAMALQYMHHIMNPSYVHTNVKSRNIFLDEEFTAKIGNFGMACCIQDGSGNAPADEPDSWSKAYLAPEYISQGTISPGLDIFAYGVVLLEALCGKMPMTRSENEGEEAVWLSDQIRSILRSDNADELREWMDDALGEDYSFDGAVTLANLARACTEKDPSTRPSAGEIVERLLRLVEELPGEQSVVNESSCKPLVQAAATNPP